MNSIRLKQVMVVLVATFSMIACEPLALTEDGAFASEELIIDSESMINETLLTENYCGTPKTVDLWAGQTIDAGDVIIYNDAEYLYVTIEATWGFQNVDENVKMWLGTDLALLPRAGSGAPINGQFPYKATILDGNTHTFQILLSDVPTYNANACNQQEIFVVIHGDVLADQGDGTISGETAFGGELPGDGNRWWFYTSYTPACCDDEEPPTTGVLETAFVKFDESGDFGTGYVFTSGKKSNPENYSSLGLTRNRWGWAGNVSADGSYTFDVWAAAGLNDTDRGTLVGSATVSKLGDEITVSYDMDAGFSMQEVHIYAGDTAPETLAPGQYGYLQYFGDEPSEYVANHSATFNVVDTDGDGVWLIMHAVAYGEM